MKRSRIVRCSEAAEHICAHLDVDTKTKRCRAVLAHIRECPNCFAYLDSVKKTVLLYRHERVPPLSRTARTRLFAVLKLERSRIKVSRS